LASRQEQKKKLREEREAREREEREKGAKRRRLIRIGLAALALVVIVVVAVVALGGGSSKKKPPPASDKLGLQITPGPWDPDYSKLPQRLKALALPDPSDQIYHVHANIEVYTDGKKQKVPANIGINPDSQFITSLHTHDDTGVIHIEAPQTQTNRQFTLGDFFKVWGQPLNDRQVATLKLQQGEEVKVWVDGKPYTGDPSKIKLASKEQIVVEIGPPFVDPPPTYTWDPSQYAQ
jgi:hypothetical protein